MPQTLTLLPPRIVGNVAPSVVTQRERAAAAQILARFRRQKTADMREEAAELTSALTAADTRIAELTALKAERAQQQAELREVQLASMAADEEAERLRRENATMRKSIADARAKEINERVDVALATWRDKKGLTEASRKMLTHLCSTAPAEFEREFQFIPADQAFLLRNFTASGSRDPRGGALPPDPQPMTLEQIAAAIQREHPALPFDQALTRAENLVKGAQK